MPRAPVSLAVIVRNESPHVEDLFKQARPFVEELVVVDTGSSDDTPEIARKYADKFEVFTACNDEEGRIANFSLAREKSFELASQPWVMWLDADDLVEGFENLEKVLSVAGDGPQMGIFRYDYAHDQYGNVICQFWRERVIRRKEAFHWLSPVHEVLAPKDPSCPKFATDLVRVVHRRQKVTRAGPSDPMRNLRILKRWYAEHGEKDARQLYYLGLECGNHKQYADAIMFHSRYVSLSGWDDEKCLACLELCKLHQITDEAQGLTANYSAAIEWALRAIAVKEDWGEPFYHLARCYYHLALTTNERRQWERCAAFARRFLNSPPARTPLFINPTERSVDVHRYMNIALNWIGDVRGALESCDAALSAFPDDPNLKYNRAIYVEHLEKEAISRALGSLVAVGKMSEEAAAIAASVVQGKFNVRKREEVAAEAAAEPRAAEAGGAGLNIAFYTGVAYERWSPKTIEASGIGGSETMAWEMARRLAKLGHRVSVYADAEGHEGIYEGVDWLDHKKFGNGYCDVLIASRRPDAVDAPGVEARLKVCWVHDIHCGNILDYRRALKNDRFLCLSNWHREFFLQTYPFVHPDQVVVTRNGIDLSLYAEPRARHPNRLIASSSPDRYLQSALAILPIVRRSVPDAELHVYYGFENWEKSADPAQRSIAEQLKAAIAATEGVVNHGRVNPRVLAEAQLESSAWIAPTWFSETSCISAMQAHAAGLRMVCSPIAALNETCGERATMVAGDWLSADYQERFAAATVAALNKTGEEDREALRQYAQKTFDLDALARDWHVMIHRMIREVERDIVPPYQAVAA